MAATPVAPANRAAVIHLTLDGEKTLCGKAIWYWSAKFLGGRRSCLHCAAIEISR